MTTRGSWDCWGGRKRERNLKKKTKKRKGRGGEPDLDLSAPEDRTGGGTEGGEALSWSTKRGLRGTQHRAIKSPKKVYYLKESSTLRYKS